ncbi:MAG: hypothetical protein ACQEQS_06200 [Thermodesulfobacteriota bacterium]
MTISDKILSIRKNRGWSQQQLTKAFNITLDYLVYREDNRY